MKITPSKKGGVCRTGTIRGTSVKEINAVLGFEPNVADDPDKVNHSWGFTVKGKNCGIWDYKGSEMIGMFSTYGPDWLFITMFGDKYSKG
jgi:hypothetical protein